MRIALGVRVADSNGRKVAARVQYVVVRSVIRMSRDVEDWTVEVMECEGKLCWSEAADKDVAAVVS